MLEYAEKISRLTHACILKNVNAQVSKEFNLFFGHCCIPFRVISSVPGRTVLGFFTTLVFVRVLVDFSTYPTLVKFPFSSSCFQLKKFHPLLYCYSFYFFYLTSSFTYDYLNSSHSLLVQCLLLSPSQLEFLFTTSTEFAITVLVWFH